MKIVKCKKCGKLIHATGQCFHCGNHIDFEDFNPVESVHENVKNEFNKIGELLSEKKYNETIEMSRVVLEWMPDCAEIFWIRLLANNKCVNDIELINKGFSYEESADFYNAIRYANNVEKEVYVDVKNKIISIQQVLEKAVKEHEYRSKLDMDIYTLQKKYSTEIEKYTQKLLKLGEILNETEQKMYVIKTDCQMKLQEPLEVLHNTRKRALALKLEINNWKKKVDNYTEDINHDYMVKLGSIFQQSENAKRNIENMKSQHPWVKEFEDLQCERDNICEQISDTITEIKNYEKEVVEIIESFKGIEKRHKKALQSLSNHKFVEIISLLGEIQFKELLNQAGLSVVIVDYNKDIFGQKLEYEILS